MTDDRCADCIHLAPWPERVRLYRWAAEAFPEFPLHACMADGGKVMAVSPSFSPDDRGCVVCGCPYFERGNREERYGEV